MLDHTNDPTRTSWVASANTDATDFPIQNLPYGVYSTTDAAARTIGVAIGDMVLDCRAAVGAGLFPSLQDNERAALQSDSLNDLMGLGSAAWTRIRHALFALLEDGTDIGDDATRQSVLTPLSNITMHVPAEIGDYTDFYASVHHATNIGSMFRPDNPLLPNYKHIPIGYHGRASSIVVSGTPVTRPHGQLKPDDAPPTFGPCKLMDYELEMGFFVGKGNAMGDRVAMDEISDHLFGMVIVNDWSARDIQKWEYQPLGPFNAKNFATTVSPWVVTMDALAPYRIDGPPRGDDDPPVLDYLAPTAPYGLDITLEVHLTSEKMREQQLDPFRVSKGNFKEMFWTIAQMLVHHSSGGCNMQPGDMLASGTISNADEGSRGCLLERTWRGQNPLSLPDGTERRLLQDGDDVIMTARCERDGAPSIGFGSCVGRVMPAR